MCGYSAHKIGTVTCTENVRNYTPRRKSIEFAAAEQ